MQSKSPEAKNYSTISLSNKADRMDKQPIPNSYHEASIMGTFEAHHVYSTQTTKAIIITQTFKDLVGTLTGTEMDPLTKGVQTSTTPQMHLKAGTTTLSQCT